MAPAQSCVFLQPLRSDNKKDSNGNNSSYYLLICVLGVFNFLFSFLYIFKMYNILLLGRKIMSNLGGILKSRDITLPTKVHLVKAMVFPVVMYGCESWTIKKAEH